MLPNLLAHRRPRNSLCPLDLVLIESGGDNLTATFSTGLIDAQIFVLDVAGGGDVARKGGPGITRADLLVINKTDLAPHVSVDLDRMITDATTARDGRPVLAISQHQPQTIERLHDWVLRLQRQHSRGEHTPTGPGPLALHSHEHVTTAQHPR